jgi:DNA-binding winged helix-turn-helix (wHTH) protein
MAAFLERFMDLGIEMYGVIPDGCSDRDDRRPRPLAAPEALASRLFFCGCAIDTAAHAMYVAGVERHLEPRGFEVLLYLIRHRHRVVSKHELLDVVWPTWHVTENVVARCVMKLRRAIGDDVRGGRMIRTVHRVGYRFDAKVEQGWSGDRPAPERQITVFAAGDLHTRPQLPPVALQDSVRMSLYAPVAKADR